MGAVQSYEDLVVWQKSKNLAVDIYRVTESFPKEELYGLTSQLRRAGVSIPSNIAEGFSRSSKEKIQFLRVAHGSGAEVMTQLVIAWELGYVAKEEHADLRKKADEVMRILNAVMHKL